MNRPLRSSVRRGTALAGIAALVGACARGGAPPPPAPPAVVDAAIPRFDVHLLLRLGERRLYLVDGETGEPLESFPIAVGRDGLETPTGEYQVEEMVEDPEYLVIDPADRTRVARRVPPGPTNPLGVRWIGFAHGDGWTVGIHGTPRPELLGGAVSHGCVRMRNEDVLRVYDRVRLGTPVVVVP